MAHLKQAKRVQVRIDAHSQLKSCPQQGYCLPGRQSLTQPSRKVTVRLNTRLPSTLSTVSRQK